MTRTQAISTTRFPRRPTRASKVPQLTQQQRSQIRWLLEEVQARTRSNPNWPPSLEEEKAIWDRLDENRRRNLDTATYSYFQGRLLNSVGLTPEDLAQ